MLIKKCKRLNILKTQIQNVFSLQKNKHKGLRQVGIFNRLFTLKSGFFQRYFLKQLAKKRNSKTIGGISYETECNRETVAFMCKTEPSKLYPAIA